MKRKTCVDAAEVKSANISHHNIEAEIYEKMHPELFSLYEASETLKNVNSMTSYSTGNELCIDVGCGTGFVTSFELPHYKTVVATDISRRMLEVVKKQFGLLSSLNLLMCDAEFLPLRSEIADVVSVSSVLHHLPRPFHSMVEMCRVVKQGGFLYMTREPNFQPLRRFFDFFDMIIVRRLTKLAGSIFRFKLSKPDTSARGLDYGKDYDEKVNIHYLMGFHIIQLTKFLRSKCFEVVSAYSYHWIFPPSDNGLMQQLLAKSNFAIEKIPLSKKLGRCLSITARKLAEVAC